MSESIWDDPRITAYVLGDLPEDQLNDFERELKSNPDLAAAVDEARGVTGQLHELYASEPAATLDEQRRQQIAAGNSDLTPAPSDSHRSKLPVLVLATAAALLLLVGVAPWLRRQQQEMAVSQLGTEASEEVATQEFDPASLGGEDESVSESLDMVEARVELAMVELQPEAGASLEGQIDPQQLAEAPSNTRQDQAKYLANDPQSGSQRSAGRPFGDDDSYARQSGETRAPAPSAAPPAPSAAPAGDTSLGSLSVAGRAKSKDSGVARDASGPSPEPAANESLAEGYAIGNRAAPTDLSRMKEVSDGKLQIVEKTEAKKLGGVALEQQVGQSLGRTSRLDYRTMEREAASPAGASPSGSSPAPPSTAATKPAYDAPVPLQKQLQGLGQVNAPEPDAAAAIRGRMEAESLRRLNTRGAVASGLDPLGGALGVPGQESDYALPIDEGRGPGIAGDRFDPITDNPFKRVSEHPLSTFSVDVDTASYSKTRDFLMRANQLPRPDAVRIEELLNYFDYDYDPPSEGDKHPFAAHATVTACPWNDQHRLARIALKGKTMEKEDRPPCNLVFLLDTSGSMNAPNKLPLVIEGMKMLLEQLDKDDKVAITVYAGSAGLVLDSTRVKKAKKVRNALTQLRAGGSTNGGAGIALAYQTARDNFITEGVNRVILCTDGDFNVGTTGTDELVRMVEQEAKGGVFLSVLGFGMGNHNDAMLEQISGRGNGNYAFIDTPLEARKVLVEQASGTLVTIAKDVKLQIEFNPQHLSSYRLIGYENRILAKEDFNDDTKDAGEIGAGHAVTALYEIVPAGVDTDAGRPEVDDLKYQTELKTTDAANSDELMTLKLRYKQPDGDTSTLVEFPVTDPDRQFADADDDVRFAAAVAGFGMQLRRSQYAGSWTMNDVLETAVDAKGEDRSGLRAEFVELVKRAKQLTGQ